MGGFTLPRIHYDLRGPVAVMTPELEKNFDFAEIEHTLSEWADRPEYVLPSGWGLQGHTALNLYMRNPGSMIHVIVPPDRALINPWWHATGVDLNRLHFIPIRGNSKLAMTTALLKGCSELLAFCEFDEYLMESDPHDGNGFEEPWRAVRMARRAGRPVGIKVLRSKEESSGITRELFLKD